jgi:hypothetical protein
MCSFHSVIILSIINMIEHMNNSLLIAEYYYMHVYIRFLFLYLFMSIWVVSSFELL